MNEEYKAPAPAKICDLEADEQHLRNDRTGVAEAMTGVGR